MNTYTCSGFRKVKASEMRDAAEVFAARQARKTYGRKGYCRVLRLNGWSENGGYGEYEAFIGYTTGPGQTTGHNVWLYVSRLTK